MKIKIKNLASNNLQTFTIEVPPVPRSLSTAKLINDKVIKKNNCISPGVLRPVSLRYSRSISRNPRTGRIISKRTHKNNKRTFVII